MYLANKASVENLEQKISMFDQDDPDVLSPELERWAEIKGRERDEKLEACFILYIASISFCASLLITSHFFHSILTR